MRTICGTVCLLSIVTGTLSHCWDAQAQVAASASASAGAQDVVVSAPQPVHNEWLFLTLEAGLAIPLNDAHRESYGLGVHGGIGVFHPFNRFLAVGLRPSYGVLREGDNVRAGGYNFGVLSGVVRLRPLARAGDSARSTGFWVEAAAGPASVESRLRAVLTPGLGYTFEVGKVGLGPMARYVQVIEPEAPDARIAVVGVELTLLDQFHANANANGDRDGDGFRDARDACPDQAEVFNGINDHDGCPDTDQAHFDSNHFVVDERVFFDFDKSVLRDTGRARLQDVAELYKVDGSSWQNLTVQGHADSRGTEEYNEALSRARAEAVKAYLVSAGIPEAKINVEAYGERRPLVPNADTPAEYQKNRRVEFVIKK